MLERIKKAFTLIELVVVIAVIAVLSAVSVVTYIGVTDSANRSSAEQMQKQITDRYQTYVIDKKSRQEQADLLEFKNVLLKEGISEFNYVHIGTAEYTSTDTVSLHAENDIPPEWQEKEELKLEVYLCVVNTTYPSYFVVTNEDPKPIITSSVFKNNEEFKNDVVFLAETKESEDGSKINTALEEKGIILDTSKDGNNGLDKVVEEGVNSGEAIIDQNTNTAQEGLIKVNYSINKKTDSKQAVYLKNGQSLLDTKLESYLISKTISNKDTNIEISYNSEVTLEDGKLLEDPYSFTFDLNSTYNDLTTDDDLFVVQEYSINIETYESTSIDQFKFLQVEISNGEKIYSLFNNSQNLPDKQASSLSYIFAYNAVISENYTLPNNWMMVVDYNTLTSDLTNVNRFIDVHYSTIESLNLLSINDSNTEPERLDHDTSETYGQYSEDSKNLTNTLTINEGVELTLSSKSALTVESLVAVGNGNSAVRFNKFAKIINNGSIALNGGGSGKESYGAVLRTLGLVEGSGTITAKYGSIIYDLFKYLNFSGGSTAYAFNSKKIFPLDMYRLDNIRNKLNLEFGSTYGIIGGVYALSSYYTLSLYFNTFEGSRYEDQCLFIAKDNSLLVKESTNDGRTKFDFNKGTFYDKSIAFKLVIQINSVNFPFPFSNFDLVVSDGATLSLKNTESGKHSRYILMPSSTLTVKNGGKLIIDNGVQLVDFKYDENIFDTLINNINKEENAKNNVSTSYKKYYSNNHIDQNRFVIEGNVQVNNGGIYSNQKETLINYVGNQIVYTNLPESSPYKMGLLAASKGTFITSPVGYSEFDMDLVYKDQA